MRLLLLLLVLAGPASADEAQFGRALYRAHCAGCHGLQARGDGWMAKYLTRRPAQLSVLAQKNGGAFPRDRVLAYIDGRTQVALHGTRDMPVWGERMTKTLVQGEPAAKRRMDALADYLAAIQE
ncbi:MAG TPA: c-type cytochrome [Burkholderiales bacterium]|jgi:mono/diheme cytochrome c family protein|nr:c-type cytochrome [Burkholderiales bacterium]